jgi:hypothetical protein
MFGDKVLTVECLRGQGRCDSCRARRWVLEGETLDYLPGKGCLPLRVHAGDADGIGFESSYGTQTRWRCWDDLVQRHCFQCKA